MTPTPVSIAAYLALFVGVGFLFLFGNLLVGKLLRPKAPNFEKLEIYECGEPAIGSSFVQFDLRFYVVALLFIIFDVEIAFFFPWAAVFGKANQLRDLSDPGRAEVAAVARAGDSLEGLTGGDRARGVADGYRRVVGDKFGELGVREPSLPRILAQPDPDADYRIGPTAAAVGALGTRMAWVSLADILVFFAVLMVGFFYVWKRGDLDWVRTVSRERAAQVQRVPPGAPAAESMLVGGRA
jgi:NADH-quinone oxidoreductase subunit A